MRGKSKMPEYWIWQRMKQRCFDANTAEFSHYGARGITVCQRWMTFEDFYADMGPRPYGMTVERINNDLGYGPENCRWATRRDQAVNRTMTQWITHNGETLCMSDWAKKSGVSKALLHYRLNAGWPIEKALQKAA
jgi:hypothetical protein